MLSHKGSYDYSSFEKACTELDRLRRQSLVALQYDKDTLIHHGLKPNMSVLDIGCGPGYLTREISNMVYNGSVLGIDIDENLLNVAKEDNCKNPVENLNYKMGDIYNLDKLGKKFDFVYCRFTFLHLEDPHLALEQIKKVLNPGGRVLIVDLDDGWLHLYPEHPIYTKIFKLQQQYQLKNGGDRFVGRKLSFYLKDTGFKKIITKIVTLTSDDIGIERFLDLTTGYKVIFLSEHSKGMITPEMIKELHEACSDGKHQLCGGFYCVSGEFTE